MESNKDKKSSIKLRQPPVVRQTRTSAYRILKANPLMMHDLDSVKKMGIQNINTIPKTVDILGISSKTNEISLACQNNINSSESQRNNATHNIDLRFKTSALLTSKKLVHSLYNKPYKFDMKIIHNNNKNVNIKSTNMYNKEPGRTSISTMYRQQRKVVRRSKSVEEFNPNKCIKKDVDKSIKTKLETSCSLDNLSHHFRSKECVVKSSDRKKIDSSSKAVGFTENVIKNSTVMIVKEHKLRRSRSAENCSFQNSKPKLIDEISQVYNSTQDLAEKTLDSISPIKREQPLFKTPIAYKRRSIVQRTPGTYRNYNIHNSTPASTDLQKRLNDWLHQHGKSLSSFHHLKCFGLCNPKTDLDKFNDTENKENKDTQVGITESVAYVSDSFVCGKDYEIIARDALNDLHKLIQDGYPLRQCEAWLSRIYQQYHKLEEEPLYWECRAIFEQSKGNISSAIEHYRKAIIRGAEVEEIEESLDKLLEKFSLLNIDPDFHKENDKEKRIILDARNAFKSTIIQFAVQERMLKKKEEETKKKLIVTPVRRSSRLSEKQSGSSSIKVCSSIKDIQMDDNTEFRRNSYLSIRFSP